MALFQFALSLTSYLKLESVETKEKCQL
jgi:hypothetical protein